MSRPQISTQLFPSDDRIVTNVVWLAFYAIALLVAVWRLPYAPVLGLLILFILIRIVAFALRVHQACTDNVYINEFRAMLGLLAVGFPVLCECVLTLVGEHFNTAATVYERKHRTFVHVLSLLLLADVAVAICYAVIVGEHNVNMTIQAYITLQLVLLGLLLLHLMFRTPTLYLTTTVFLGCLILLLLIPPTYLELRYKNAGSWILNHPGDAFNILWALPEALVTSTLLSKNLYFFYPNYRSPLII